MATTKEVKTNYSVKLFTDQKKRLQQISTDSEVMRVYGCAGNFVLAAAEEKFKELTEKETK